MFRQLDMYDLCSRKGNRVGQYCRVLKSFCCPKGFLQVRGKHYSRFALEQITVSVKQITIVSLNKFYIYNFKNFITKNGTLTKVSIAVITEIPDDTAL